MIISFGRMIVVFVLLCASVAGAQERSFVEVVDWVRRDGKPNLVWDEAKALRLETSVTKAAQKLIVKMEVKRFYGMQVYDDHTDVVMLRRSPERTAVWRVTRDGKIVQTLTFVGARTDAKIVPNEQHIDWWKETLGVLRDSMSAN